MFRLVSLPKAQANFDNLEPDDFKELDVFKALPGVYKAHVVKKSGRWLRLLLRDAVLQVAEKRAREHDEARESEYENMLKPGLNPTRIDFCRIPIWPAWDNWDEEEDKNKQREYIGMGIIRFPYLKPDNTLEYGHSCKGCEWEYLQFESSQALYDTELMGRRDGEISHTLRRRSLRAFSKSEFLTHIKGCYGAQELLSSPSIEASEREQ